MKTHNIWITLLTNTCVEQLIGRLVSHGHAIMMMGPNVIYETDDALGCLVAFSITTSKDDLTNTMVRDEIRATMKLLQMSYFSIIVTDVTSSAFGGSNIWRTIDEPNLDKVVH
jgi:TRAP-type mannitol/chloroaromatic compound transport system permease large subunit